MRVSNPVLSLFDQRTLAISYRIRSQEAVSAMKFIIIVQFFLSVCNVCKAVNQNVFNIYLDDTLTDDTTFRSRINSIEDLSKLRSTYDFVIVGAGPAGSVLANRLTENPKWNVLLIEAGGTENFFHDIPVMAAFLQGTASNWNYKSTSQISACFGMNNRQCSLPRGKVVGGTSSINYMIYNRGNRKDFDKWAEAGNTGWSYAEVLPYFLKSENANLRKWRQSPYHSTSGLLSVEDVPYRTNVVKAFIQAGKEYGLSEIDYNGETQLGISYVQATTLKGRRHSAAQAFLSPVKHRPNLHLILHSRVTRILINPLTKDTYGVEFVKNKKVHKIYVTKEVVLSAGAFNSPQLLMLSGVGPKKHLNQMQIPLVKNLPVGEIMFDHLSHFGPTFILNSTNSRLSVGDLNIKDFKQFLRGQGRLTIIGGVEALAFLKTPNSDQPPDVPDVEIILVAGSFASDEGTGLKQGANIKDDLYNKVFKPLERLQNDHFSFLILQFHPKSIGNLRLQDKNPFKWPIIDPQYLKQQDDVETILHGIKAGIKILKSPALQKLGARLHDIPLPQCKQYHFASDDYWRCSIRTLSYTLHHQVATCKMGRSNDSTAVVNADLKVHGVHKLRVADTSIVPFPPTSHTNAVSFMIGEKASDLIKASWK